MAEAFERELDPRREDLQAEIRKMAAKLQRRVDGDVYREFLGALQRLDGLPVVELKVLRQAMRASLRAAQRPPGDDGGSSAVLDSQSASDTIVGGVFVRDLFDEARLLWEVADPVAFSGTVRRLVDAVGAKRLAEEMALSKIGFLNDFFIDCGQSSAGQARGHAFIHRHCADAQVAARIVMEFDNDCVRAIVLRDGS
jgi:hypothetical protein